MYFLFFLLSLFNKLNSCSCLSFPLLLFSWRDLIQPVQVHSSSSSSCSSTATWWWCTTICSSSTTGGMWPLFLPVHLYSIPVSDWRTSSFPNEGPEVDDIYPDITISHTNKWDRLWPFSSSGSTPFTTAFLFYSTVIVSSGNCWTFRGILLQRGNNYQGNVNERKGMEPGQKVLLLLLLLIFPNSLSWQDDPSNVTAVKWKELLLHRRLWKYYPGSTKRKRIPPTVVTTGTTTVTFLVLLLPLLSYTFVMLQLMDITLGVFRITVLGQQDNNCKNKNLKRTSFHFSVVPLVRCLIFTLQL